MSARCTAVWMRAGALALAALACPGTLRAQEASALHGFVRNADSGEPIPSALIQVEELTVRTDRAGYFAIRAAPASPRLRVRALGYAPLDTTLMRSTSAIELRLRPLAHELATVRVAASAEDRPLDVPEISVQTVTPAQVERVPVALERDLFRAIQAMPGVISPGPYSGRLLVRGGTADQNLFLLDGYPVLHPYHLTGAFSAFHMDAVQDAELWLGVPPARHGGRLASVLDVALREGNREELTGAASLGVLSSAAVVEGPHGSGAWFVGLRTTYLDVLTRALGHEVPYRFHDAYAKTHVDLGPSDRLSVLLFFGQDATWRAQTKSDRFDWKNAVYGISWRRLLGGQAVYEQRFSHSTFGELLDRGNVELRDAAVLTDHHVALSVARGELRLVPTARHAFEAGWSVEHRRMSTALRYETGFDRSLITATNDTVATTTLVLHAQDDVRLSDAMHLRLGVRGERHPLATSIQPRVVARVLLTPALALSAGVGMIRQYDHLLQDPDVAFDIYVADIWLPGGVRELPISSAVHYVSSLEWRLPGRARLKAEAYAKRTRGTLTLPPYGASDPRFAVQRVEVTRGLDDGLDLSVFTDASRRLQGWVGYSLARSARRLGDSTFAADPYPRQRLVVVAESPMGRWTATGRVELFEGVPFTPAIAMVQERGFDFGRNRFSSDCFGTTLEYLYGTRNSARTGISKRLDLGAARRWTDSGGRKWELGFGLVNAVFDPVGVFRPAEAGPPHGCSAPARVPRAYEVMLPPIPSVSIRVEF